jgi:hypothetical protein
MVVSFVIQILLEDSKIRRTMLKDKKIYHQKTVTNRKQNYPKGGHPLTNRPYLTENRIIQRVATP